MSAKYKIAETDNFSKKLKHRDYIKLASKIENFVYPQLKENPFYGKNIKKLKGKYNKVYRYRIGIFRLFYTIDNDKILIIFIDIEKRKDSYKD
ncbi:MAG: type II toxin-antitoxin system RelE/ParE family toxin [Spirochaetia bacterium]|nr:type II toxin-antitoxin system RelE/ParE family toxin [Spirochaetia bacterium]